MSKISVMRKDNYRHTTCPTYCNCDAKWQLSSNNMKWITVMFHPSESIFIPKG